MIDGPEFHSPGEDTEQTEESVSEQAGQRFSGIGQALKQLKEEEKKSKKGDSRVAKTISKFLQDKAKAHIAILIARLVARNCPSTFLIALLSLVDTESQKLLSELFPERKKEAQTENVATALQKSLNLQEPNNEIRIWIFHLQATLSVYHKEVLQSLLLKNGALDETLLQASVFLLQEKLLEQQKEMGYEEIQPVAAALLQQLFMPHLATASIAQETPPEEAAPSQ